MKIAIGYANYTNCLANWLKPHRIHFKQERSMTFNHLHKHLYRRRGGLLFFVLTCLFSLEGYSQGADLFSAQALIAEGKKLAVIPTDLDGR